MGQNTKNGKKFNVSKKFDIDILEGIFLKTVLQYFFRTYYKIII